MNFYYAIVISYMYFFTHLFMFCITTELMLGYICKVYSCVRPIKNKPYKISEFLLLLHKQLISQLLNEHEHENSVCYKILIKDKYSV